MKSRTIMVILVGFLIANISQINTINAAATNGNELVKDLSDDPNYFIYPESDTRYLLRDEIVMDNDILQMAINEIYARKGRKFKTPEIQAYFDKKTWYKGTIEAAAFSDQLLNEYERANINVLSHYINEVPEVEEDTEVISEEIISEYISIDDTSITGDMSEYIGQKVCYQGYLTGNNNSCFIISDAGWTPRISALYDDETIRDAPSNRAIQEDNMRAKVWGVAYGYDTEQGLQISLDYICISNEFDYNCKNAKFVKDRYALKSIADDSAELIKIYGVLRNNECWMWLDGEDSSKRDVAEVLFNGSGDKFKYLCTNTPISWDDYLSIGFNNDYFLYPLYMDTTADSFTNKPVIAYGKYLKNLESFSIVFLDPLPEQRWTPDIREMMEDTKDVLQLKAEVANEFANEFTEKFGDFFDDISNR